MKEAVAANDSNFDLTEVVLECARRGWGRRGRERCSAYPLAASEFASTLIRRRRYHQPVVKRRGTFPPSSRRSLVTCVPVPCPVRSSRCCCLLLLIPGFAKVEREL
ncbi:unnamed protein product, partial [Pylaiella littoralis]